VSGGKANVGIEGGGKARRRRGMVGSVPPSSMRSMSSSVKAAPVISHLPLVGVHCGAMVVSLANQEYTSTSTRADRDEYER